MQIALLAPDGREWCYGYYASYGGAVDLGRDAIRAVLREEDGRGQPTRLTPVVLARLGYPSAEALQKGITAGELVHPIRVAISGSAAGPSLFQMLDVMGKERVLRRMDRTLRLFGG